MLSPTTKRRFPIAPPLFIGSLAGTIHWQFEGEGGALARPSAVGKGAAAHLPGRQCSAVQAETETEVTDSFINCSMLKSARLAAGWLVASSAKAATAIIGEQS